MLPVTTTKPETLTRGDVFQHVMAGGGGFGPPTERDPARVLEDVRAERTSIGHAYSAYGVVIDMSSDGLKVNVSGTAKGRAEAIQPYGGAG